MDRDAIAADRRDVAHVTVKILDAQGRVVPVADNEVAFEIQGEGKIIGVDNGNPASHEDYKGKRRKAFNGLCLAIVQSTAKPGRIQLTATSPGTQSGSVTIDPTTPAQDGKDQDMRRIYSFVAGAFALPHLRGVRAGEGAADSPPREERRALRPVCGRCPLLHFGRAGE